MKIVLNSIYYFFVVCVLAIALLLLASIVPIPGNFKAKIVKSGSMEPTIMTGGLVFIAPSATYEIGDIVTFGADTKTQIPTTHRIISIDGDGPLRTFSTKGDANDAPDPSPIRLADIEGKVILSLPYLGYVLDFAKRPLGFILLVGVPALIIIFDEIAKIIREIKLIRRKKSSNATEQENSE